MKNEFIFYLRISRYSKAIHFAYLCQAAITKLNLGFIDKFVIKILKYSRRGSRSPDKTELGYFRLLGTLPIYDGDGEDDA